MTGVASGWGRLAQRRQPRSCVQEFLAPSRPLLVMRRLLLAALLIHAPALAAQATQVRGYLTDSSLAFLGPLVGMWRPLHVPDSIARLDPPVVAQDYRWTVGRKALVHRERFRKGQPESSALTGLVFWNPATERVEWVAVAGAGEGEGRFFSGEYRLLENGAIEREYDVFYRAPADVPGDAFGGLRRRYRETYRLVTPDSIATTLEWFHDGAWRPFGPFARGAFKRIPEG